MKREQAMQKEEITALVATVGRTSASYDRYTNVSTIITFSEPRYDVIPDCLFSAVSMPAFLQSYSSELSLTDDAEP